MNDKINDKAKIRSDVKGVSLCALFTALTAVGAFIKIPIEPMVITLQLFFVTLSGMLLGARRGAFSCAVYMLMGLCGIPVFTQGGGIGYVLKPSFGYIIAFILGSFIAGKIAFGREKPSYTRLFAAMLACLAVVYAIGIVYFIVIMKFYLGKTLTFNSVFMSLFVLLLPGDLITGTLAVLISKRLIPILNKLERSVGS